MQSKIFPDYFSLHLGLAFLTFIELSAGFYKERKKQD